MTRADRKAKKVAKKQAKLSKKTEKERVEERREEILSNGRKFKYPLQYAKHHLVLITIIIAILAVVILGVVGWFTIYKVQNTGDTMYRVTQVLPLPVAKVDGENVRFSDYLMIYRSSIKTVEQQSGQLGNTEEDESLRDQYKRAALNNAEEYAYAVKLGRELGIEVTSDEIDEAAASQRKVGGKERSNEGFLKVLEDNFGMTEEEYRRMLYLLIMKKKVSIEIDDQAKNTASAVEAKIAESGGDFRAVAEVLGDKIQYEETGGLVDAMNIDGGRAVMASSLEPGVISGKFISANGDGYYFVKLINKNDTQVNYASIKVPFTEFAKRLVGLRDGGSIEEYIVFPEQ